MAAGITVKRRKTKRGAQMRRDDGPRLVGRKVFLGTFVTDDKLWTGAARGLYCCVYRKPHPD